MESDNIFNTGNTSHVEGKHPLFLGQQNGLYDNVHVNYPKLFKLYEELKSIDWTHNELDLSSTKVDLLKGDKVLRDVMLINLAYQWKTDSAIGNSLATLFQPFSSNSEYSHGIHRIAENENLHALTYSNITRHCVPNPQEVFDLVYKTEQVLGRTASALNALSELDRVGCLYKLGMMTAEACEPYILKGEIAVYALERISFMNSFASTFGLGQADLYLGAAKYVQKICLDEVKHFSFHAEVVRIMRFEDPRFIKYFKDHKFLTEVQAMIDEIYEYELRFNDFLLSEGRRCPNLTKDLLDDWCRYNAWPVYNAVGLVPPFERVTKDPLPWVAEDWVNINATQNANMESNNSNYALGVVKQTSSEASFDEFEL